MKKFIIQGTKGVQNQVKIYTTVYFENVQKTYGMLKCKYTEFETFLGGEIYKLVSGKVKLNLDSWKEVPVKVAAAIEDFFLKFFKYVKETCEKKGILNGHNKKMVLQQMLGIYFIDTVINC